MAYALVVSLKQTFELLVNSARSRIQISKSEVLQPIYEDLCYLKSFFDKMNSLEDSNSVEEVEKDMKDVLQNARNLIESHLSDLVHSGGDGSWLSRELVELKDKLAPFINVLKAKENELTGKGKHQQLPTADVAFAAPVPSSRMEHGFIVGIKAEAATLQQLLFERDSRLQLVYIVGMFGIGKTTLAFNVYNHRGTLYKFHMRLFVEIGVEYKVEELLLRLLGQVQRVSEAKNEETVDELGNRLKACLSRRTYLVVLDDLRDMRAWDQLRPYFPDEGNGSRIVITTRLTNVECVTKYVHRKHFLTNEESWRLFREVAFHDMKMDKCDRRLEAIGKEIATNIQGLPLALVEIGELVSKLPKTVECWSEFALNMNLHIQNTTIPKVVSAELPHYLKACFLYLGVFQPDDDIPASQLIKLWVAEGFIKPEADQSMEQIAEEYLEDLVSRGLVTVQERSFTGRIKTCRLILKLVRDVCVSEARRQKMFHIVNQGTTSSRGGLKKQRRVSIQGDVALGAMGLVVRSLVFMCAQNHDPLPMFSRVRWLRVLHSIPIRFSKFPDQLLKLVRLRYLAISFDGELPSSISTLWDLQVLIIVSSQAMSSPVFLPLEIWKLQKLRHLHCMGFELPSPSTDVYLMNLVALSGVSFRTCGDGVLARIPNLIKLGIRFVPADRGVEASCFHAVFSYFHHLESFKCAVTNQLSEAAFSLIGLPSGLTKVTLCGTGFVWDEHSTIISELINLQVLKLRWRAFCGSKWELREGGFPRLKVLVLEDLDIEELIAESNHFPVLQQLLIRRCSKLQEIPLDMGEIPTLEVIEVDDGSVSLVESARRIRKEQEELGNENLKIRIHSSSLGSRVR